jgi:hypothetical protein
MMAWRL